MKLHRALHLPAATTILAGALLVGGVVSGPATAHSSPARQTATEQSAESAGSPRAALSTRAQTLQRARTWLTANKGRPVPYSQSARWRDGYRQDCSGYASMALGLAKGRWGGPNTVALARTRSLTRPIAMSALKPGDLVIDADGSNKTRHVVIFEKWNNPARTSYTAYEQRGSHGTTHRSLRYGLNANDQFDAFRPVQYGNN
ncbi:hypothetical protein [Streptomyces sp. UH6]|uniref:hypothetical protein n=1 Tax=Streptomyces sp. UH6 TaxID=2748379 RepID=UPI0015D48CDD|nr:hypothetical protein [Streptomyces sp. UH6]NYV73031.1 hypothetical protein [Streptomyces sp. UH6]